MLKKIGRKWVYSFVIILLTIALLWGVIGRLDFSQKGRPVKFGVTFSHQYASQNLGLDWTEVYWYIINDLGVKDIRLVVPWDVLEERKNEYNFTDWEWMIGEARKKDINIILTIGRRTPRWPECHDPVWLKNMSKSRQDKEVLNMLVKVVKHFREYRNIVAWQVENEPLLNLFGKCPKADKHLLKEEVDLVSHLDKRPIIITDTGELSSWDDAASLADILGVTMYKTVWNKFIGIWRYPWPPAYYYFKAKHIKNKYHLSKVIVSELQAEPWAKGEENIIDMNLVDQLNLFNKNDLQNNLKYVRQAGFDEAYLWGVEWWYWLKKVKNRSDFWDEAKLIWQSN